MKMINPTKSADKREKQRQALIDEAEKMILAGGLGCMKARDLAMRVGIALGQIYNLVRDLDEVILVVNSRTIAHLEARIAQRVNFFGSSSGEEKLIATAIAYHHFARENYHLWHALFDHQPATTQKTLSVQVSADRLRPFRLIEQLLIPLCPTMSIWEVRLFAQTLFSSVHGIILLALDARDVGVPPEQIDDQLRLYLSLLCRGLNQP